MLSEEERKAYEHIIEQLRLIREDIKKYLEKGDKNEGKNIKN